MKIELTKDIVGTILDIGGGGEGIIGRLYKDQVTAIDNCQEELDEAPDCCKKLLMDASNLTLSSGSFDNVTCFYSLMYMPKATQEKAMKEAWRVLRPQGKLYIWDAEIASAFPEPYIVELDILLASNMVHTSYGIVKDEPQTVSVLTRMIEECGFVLLHSTFTEGHFRLCFSKA